MTTAKQAAPLGKFIAIEGVDGAGKGVQSRRLQASLQQQGLQVLLTREPGGSPGAEEIRQLLVCGAADKWDAMTELLLINAARRDHLRRTIEPALAAGSWVISDRYADSSRAFQGLAGELGLELVDTVHALVTDNRNPDLTLVLDLDPATSLARAQSRGDNEDRFEKKGLQYQLRVQEGFRMLAARSPESHVLIDASGSVDCVAERVLIALQRHFPGLPTGEREE
ncbi:MAG TPA: dTMP kinase [Pseudomonadaceae bacterium]|nr:dTMP kinase [Pseudomonadaceae bacterium]